MGVKTSFANLMPEEKQAYKNEAFRLAMEKSFWTRFMGGADAVVADVKDVIVGQKTIRAFLHLVPGLDATGVVGDNTMDGNEAGLSAEFEEIKIDQLRQALSTTGEFDDRRSVINFRKEALTALSDWLAITIDSLMFNTASGITYGFDNDGSARTVVAGQQNFTALQYAGDVKVPTSKRHLTYTGSALVTGDTSTVTAAYLPSYEMIVKLKAYAQTHGVKPLNIGGKSTYILVVHPLTFALLKLDSKFNAALTTALQRGNDNPIFTGADAVLMDGIVIHTSERVHTTLGAAAASKWGAGGLVDGTRSLLLGKTALAYAAVEDKGEWREDTKDFGNIKQIAIRSMFGMLKPQFKSPKDGDTLQDFGLIAVDTALVA